MFTTNFSPLRAGHRELLLLRGEGGVRGSRRLSSASISVNGLNAEPGWRWPFVARLKGRFSKSVPPTIALTSPVLFSIATSEALGPDAVQPAVDRLLGRRLQLGVERGLDLQAAAEHRRRL